MINYSLNEDGYTSSLDDRPLGCDCKTHKARKASGVICLFRFKKPVSRASESNEEVEHCF